MSIAKPEAISTPKPASKTGTARSADSLPYLWTDIEGKLSLPPQQTISQLILSSSFLNPFLKYRDLLPLTPGTPLALISQDKESIAAFVNTIYAALDAMHASIYDNPNSILISSWAPIDHFACLVYQIVRNLARPAHALETAFQRANLKNDAGRKEALKRIQGVMMVSLNLTGNYTMLPPSKIVVKIETMHPASNPDRSPILEVRTRFKLEKMGVEELRKAVLDVERRGEGCCAKEEKDWLIGLLMGVEGLGRAARMGSVDKGMEIEVKEEVAEHAVQSGVKRRREDDDCGGRQMDKVKKV